WYSGRYDASVRDRECIPQPDHGDAELRAPRRQLRQHVGVRHQGDGFAGINARYAVGWQTGGFGPPPRSPEDRSPSSPALALHDGALLGVHLLPDARAPAEVPHAAAAALGEELLVGLGRDVFVRPLVGDADPEKLLHEVDVVHADGVVVGEQRTHLDADVAPDALLEAVLHRLHAPAWQRAGREVLDALDRAELGALAAREAEVYVHERDLARPLLLLADLVGEGRVGDALLLQATFDDVDRRHTSLRPSGSTGVSRKPSRPCAAYRPRAQLRDRPDGNARRRPRDATPGSYLRGLEGALVRDPGRASTVRGVCARSVATDRPATANRPSAREPVDQGEHEADQAAHDGAVQPDELEIRAHAVLDLPHELLVAEPLEALAHREADLGVVAAEEVARGRPHPTVEGAAAAHVREELEDAGAQLAVDQRRERALPVGEVLLELLAQAGEHGADDRTGLDALEERATQPLGLCLRGGVAGGEPLGEATERCEHGSAEGMRRVACGAAQLGGGVVAGRLDDRALHDLAAEHEGQETLAGGVQRPGGAVEPPVQLRGRARPGREVGERQREALERRAGALARHRAREPSPRRGVERQLAELSLGDAVDEVDDLLLGEDPRDATQEIAQRRAETLDVRRVAEPIGDDRARRQAAEPRADHLRGQPL